MKKQIKTTLPVTKNVNIISAQSFDTENGLWHYIKTIQKFPILTAEQEYNYAKLWINTHDQAAAEHLIASHLRLVVSVAYDFKNYGISMTDLIASGNMGLMQALQKFDPEKGFRFSTYAMFWIKAEIYETILNNWSIVKIGSSANQKRVFFNLSKAKRALGIIDSNLSDAQTQQIANYLSVSPSDVNDMAVRINARDTSLNAPIYNDSGKTDLLSNLTDSNTNIEESIENIETKRNDHMILYKHLAQLSEREQDIIRSRRLTETPITLEALSQKYNISRERVRQIEDKAFEKLKTAIINDKK